MVDASNIAVWGALDQTYWSKTEPIAFFFLKNEVDLKQSVVPLIENCSQFTIYLLFYTLII